MNDTLQSTLDWFKLIIPDPLQDPMLARKAFHTQLGVHFEEVAEMVIELKTIDNETAALLNDAHTALVALATHLKKSTDAVHIEDEDMHNYVDAICDQLVTAAGCAAHVEADIVGALDEVNRSNWSKFVDGKPIFDENRKVAKGPNYTKPDITPFLPA